MKIDGGGGQGIHVGGQFGIGPPQCPKGIESFRRRPDCAGDAGSRGGNRPAERIQVGQFIAGVGIAVHREPAGPLRIRTDQVDLATLPFQKYLVIFQIGRDEAMRPAPLGGKDGNCLLYTSRCV